MELTFETFPFGNKPAVSKTSSMKGTHPPLMKTSWSDWNLGKTVVFHAIYRRPLVFEQSKTSKVKHAKAYKSLWQQLRVANFFLHLFLTYIYIYIYVSIIFCMQLSWNQDFSQIPCIFIHSLILSISTLSSLETVASIAEEPHTGYLRCSANATIVWGEALARKPCGNLLNNLKKIQIKFILFFWSPNSYTHSLHPKCTRKKTTCNCNKHSFWKIAYHQGKKNKSLPIFPPTNGLLNGL